MDKHPIPTTAGSGLRRHRLVSFLGTGRFDKTTGRWFYDTTRHGFPDGAEGPETPYVCRALAQYLTADEITIIATPEARAAHGDGVTTELHSANLPAPVFQSIPKGENGAELWQQFETVKGLLRPPAGTEVALDITHAFRSQPFFAAAVAAFVRAVDPTPAALRIFYAAYEPGKAVTPVWELTPFIDLVDWAQGMMLFLRTGRSEGVAERTIRLGDELERRWAETKQGPQLHLKRLGETLRRFGRNLEMVRTGDLLLGQPAGSAAGMAAALAAARESAQRVPPLADVLDRLQNEMVKPLLGASDHLANKAGHRALAALARLYLDMGRWAEAAAIVREGWITRHAVPAALGERRDAKPGIDEGLRRNAEDRWTREEGDVARSVAEVRNDIEHAGFKRQPLPADTLQRQVRNLVERFAVLPPAAARPKEAGVTPVFVNLSNHPSRYWGEAQKEAALRFAPEIHDWPFPPVPPEAEAAAIADLAKRTEAALVDALPGATHVMVQGEFTLAHALVRRLQQRGLVCLVATTRRQVLEDRGAIKTTRFEFVRFREYG